MQRAPKAEIFKMLLKKHFGKLPVGYIYAPIDPFMEELFKATKSNKQKLMSYPRLEELLRTHMFDPGNKPRSAGTASSIRTKAGHEFFHNGQGKIGSAKILGHEVVHGKGNGATIFVYIQGIMAVPEMKLASFLKK